MSDLQISLIAIGFVVIGGVVFFNWMQQRRYQRGTEDAFKHKYKDVLLEPDKSTSKEERIEPQFGKEMPKDLQVRLLRVLDDYKVRPIGYIKEVSLDVRVLAASNHSIDDLKNKYLREDLFFRLAVIVIELPPLRDRKSDIPLLIENFINTFNQKYSKNIEGLSEEAFNFLYSYDFPGNIRELENLIEGIIAVNSPDKDTITYKDLKAHLLWQEPKTSEHQILALDKLEKFAFNEALRESKGNKSRAAELLGISRDTLYRKLKLFKIQ